MSIEICKNCDVEFDTDYEVGVEGYCTECAWEVGLLSEEDE